MTTFKTVSIGDTPTPILTADDIAQLAAIEKALPANGGQPQRLAVTIVNTGTRILDIGGSDVAHGMGMPLLQQGEMAISRQANLFAVAFATGELTVVYVVPSDEAPKQDAPRSTAYTEDLDTEGQ
jgi:hypothetical protein